MNTEQAFKTAVLGHYTFRHTRGVLNVADLFNKAGQDLLEEIYRSLTAERNITAGDSLFGETPTQNKLETKILLVKMAFKDLKDRENVEQRRQDAIAQLEDVRRVEYAQNTKALKKMSAEDLAAFKAELEALAG